jgi:hypothetical protein
MMTQFDQGLDPVSTITILQAIQWAIARLSILRLLERFKRMRISRIEQGSQQCRFLIISRSLLKEAVEDNIKITLQ